MDASRANIIAKITDEVKTLGKSLKLNGQKGINVSKIPEPKNAIGQPVQGSGFVRILMYIIAGILLIGIILLGVDQWITPVFQRSPGAPGYIAIPGTDKSQQFWSKISDVKPITVGTPAITTDLSSTVIEGQTSYSITMDVLIENEYPQDIGTGQNQRILFTMSNLIDTPTLRVSLDNGQNTIYITCYDSSNQPQSVIIDNVPIHTPFRIGITVSPYLLEGYLNGLLVQTNKLTSCPKAASSGDKIFATDQIIINNKTMSTGIKVLNIRTFGYNVSSSEMKGRMGDLKDKSNYK
jgi:hypothetical protein